MHSTDQQNEQRTENHQSCKYPPVGEWICGFCGAKKKDMMMRQRNNAACLRKQKERRHLKSKPKQAASHSSSSTADPVVTHAQNKLDGLLPMADHKAKTRWLSHLQDCYEVGMDLSS